MLEMRNKIPSLPKMNSQILRTLKHGTKISIAGLVLVRQKPPTANGVCFATMEDEFGFTNLVLWSRVFDQFRHVATTSAVLLAHGKIERNGEVVYLLVEGLERVGTNELPSASRDFH